MRASPRAAHSPRVLRSSDAAAAPRDGLGSSVVVRGLVSTVRTGTEALRTPLQGLASLWEAGCGRQGARQFQRSR